MANKAHETFNFLFSCCLTAQKSLGTTINVFLHSQWTLIRGKVHAALPEPQLLAKHLQHDD
jgi:hypothetical protein